MVLVNDEDINEYGWREYWGMKFKWTPEHLTSKDLEPLIRTYDTVATEAVERLDELSPPPKKEVPEENYETPTAEKKVRRDLYELLKQHGTTDKKAKRLWSEVNTIPDWVDWEQIERGQKVFYRYGGPAITSLTFLSLLGGMGSGRTVETLDRTGGFSAEVVRRRLLETTQHTLNVTRDLESIKPGGDGFADSIRVRMLHATVRRRVMKMAASRPGYYDMQAFGIPINDLDCIGTINAFSATVLWMGLQRQGIYLRRQETADYLALWRYVAYLMGTPHDWLSTPESARRMMESLLVSEIKPTRASANLANNIITGLQGQPPTYASKEFMCAQTYWLNGRELSEALSIDRPGPWYFALVLGQCILFMALSYVNRSVGYLDERNIKLVRKAFYQILLQDKSKGALGYTSKFNIKYVPSFAKTSTERGASASRVMRDTLGKAERTALVSLLASAAFVGASVWCCAKAVAWLVSG
ncbi:uncharacterized protein GGS22DRAFT_179856 [Annulohypoxylon maeteangense]|uniref:uncharacterized protein n=1 Tax=Annulohypoxylon maeteangense TaxID=1927788 RepID=UPI0020079920|nr:uncharacterized protein GGS22DRAFT_179856 [Annulohypoxylon maeteangense]KAI0885314.1 hypothetical protein GGS22DRAFT_179856 [Annulohypoxylon maeteangense]